MDEISIKMARQLVEDVNKHNLQQQVIEASNIKVIKKLLEDVDIASSSIKDSQYLKEREAEVHLLLRDIRKFSEIDTSVPKKERVKIHDALLIRTKQLVNDIYTQTESDLNEARN